MKLKVVIYLILKKNKFFNALEKIPDAADKVQFNAYQYVIKADVESASE